MKWSSWIQTCKMGDQPYSDISPKGECSLLWVNNQTTTNNTRTDKKLTHVRYQYLSPALKLPTSYIVTAEDKKLSRCWTHFVAVLFNPTVPSSNRSKLSKENSLVHLSYSCTVTHRDRRKFAFPCVRLYEPSARGRMVVVPKSLTSTEQSNTHWLTLANVYAVRSIVHSFVWKFSRLARKRNETRAKSKNQKSANLLHRFRRKFETFALIFIRTECDSFRVQKRDRGRGEKSQSRKNSVRSLSVG